MRRPFRINYFSHILNLFTSFGYFDSEKDNLAVMHAVHKMLKPKGLFVLDFMNVHKVVSNLVEKEIKTVAGVTFHISKQIENDFIIKHIRFSDKGENFEYQERVKVLELKDFERYLCEADLKIVNLFGNYQLAPYDESTSERLIIIAHKE
ncbi:MAG TPA: class I SAM-dependent methyltransferase, partial [Chitinophagales bacterium]|nr:class I SAM-dependent methyltransferase [Chitinophagales bacterium]